MVGYYGFMKQTPYWGIQTPKSCSLFLVTAFNRHFVSIFISMFKKFMHDLSHFWMDRLCTILKRQLLYLQSSTTTFNRPRKLFLSKKQSVYSM